jgi:hypothetical protein
MKKEKLFLNHCYRRHVYKERFTIPFLKITSNEQNNTKPERDIKLEIDMRNKYTEMTNIDENTNNKLIIIQTNYLERILMFNNTGKQFLMKLQTFLYVHIYAN